jgi:hypothetical protein
MSLSNFKSIEYPETQEQEHILEQYKLYIQSAEKVSDRRHNVNKFYSSLATSIAGVIGYVKTNNLKNDQYLILVLSISAILACIYWLNLLENYRKLNLAKFNVIHEIENLLPLRLFDFEWEKLGRAKDKMLYKKMSSIEKGIPIIFVALFLFMIIAEVLELCCKC